MKNLSPALSFVLAASLCATLAGCANTPSRGYSSQAPAAAPASAQPSYTDRGASKPALTIQAGEGEKLNLPWFVQDIQGAVNRGTGPTTEWRSIDNP
ncbi:Lipoprotein [Bordetella sputigena]|uniref:hypothetical protein n=1 Tax=Bordetella sputigena TaxID=1416810 RepID=UPI0039EEBB8A